MKMLKSPEPFISNDLFHMYSDIQLMQPYDVLLPTPNKKIPIILVYTDVLFYHIRSLLQFPHSFVLITTSNTDNCVPYMEFPTLNRDIVHAANSLLDCKNLIQWFTKNPCIFHPKLRPIPLGPKWQYHSRLFFGEDKTNIVSILKKYGLAPEENFRRPKSNLLYMNFSESTTKQPHIKSHKNMRPTAKSALLANGFSWNSNKNFEEYLQELATYKFAISPPGNGVDTHRTWECLLVGTIPIMYSTHLDSLFDNLPVVIIKDWSLITPEFLESEYAKLQSKTSYDFSSLYSDYWIREIQVVAADSAAFLYK